MFPAAKFGCVQAIKTFDQCYDRHTMLQMFCPQRKLVISETHTSDNAAGNNQVRAILGRKCSWKMAESRRHLNNFFTLWRPSDLTSWETREEMELVLASLLSPLFSCFRAIACCINVVRSGPALLVREILALVLEQSCLLRWVMTKKGTADPDKWCPARLVMGNYHRGS